MATQKQCPKCGEKNPAEAVMCWACYTSLSGGAMAPAGAGPAGAAPGGALSDSASDSGEKKKVEPKQLAVIGVGLLIAVGFGVKTLMGGSEENLEEVISFPPPITKAPAEPTSPTGGGGAAQTVGLAPDMPQGVAPIAKFPYSMVSAPNPRYSAASVAIVPTENDVTEGEAKGLATLAHQHMKKVKDFKRVEIFVFNDPNAAQEFAGYQNDQRGAPIQDYTAPRLMGIWPKAMTRYLAEGNKAVYSSPQKNPTTFWKKTTS